MRKVLSVLMVCMMTVLSACATNIGKPQIRPAAAKVKLGKFSKIEIAPIEKKASVTEGNMKAIKKIEENFVSEMKMAFPGVEKVATKDSLAQSGDVLRIELLVKEIKFIGGAARFWVGSMAGSSAVLLYMKATDVATGDVVAEGDFYTDSGAQAGGMSIGVSDNLMLKTIAKDVVGYLSYNK